MARIRNGLARLILITIIIMFCLTITAYGAAQFSCPPGSMRVALGLNLSSAEFAVVEGEYELVDYMTQRIISPNSQGNWLVAPAGGFGFQLSNNGQKIQGLTGALLVLRQKNCEGQNIFRFKSKKYRGDLLIENINGQIQMINVIDIEQYLYGVVGPEIGANAPDEALKAQAVVSRTYALYYKENPQLHYDVGITTQWQVYGGYDMEVQGGERVKKAVDDTRGQVIYYDNKIIQAFFHANSGGYTEACENVWYSSIPYINPVATPEDAHVLQVSQQEGWPAVTYQWEKTFTRQELMEQLKKWNREHPSESVNVGEIRDLKTGLLAVDPVSKEYTAYETISRRVTQLDIIGSQGMKSFLKDKIRSVLDLRSTMFNISMDSTVKIWTAFGTLDVFNLTKDVLAVTADGLTGKLNGNNGHYYVIGAEGVKSVPKQFNQVIISGKGYGHGLGMSQWGARGMAVQGQNYQLILLHYYNQGRNDGRLVIRNYAPF